MSTNNQTKSSQPNQSRQKQSSALISYPNRITLLTLVSYGLGLMILNNIYVSVVGFAWFLGLIFGMSKLHLFYPGYITLFKIAATVYVFGIIHCYSYRNIQNFQTNSNNAPQIQQITAQSLQTSHQLTHITSSWPLLQIYLSILCVYYYFQFQLNNNYHHAQLCWNSFLIYHSKPYTIANFFMLTEHLVTKYLFGFGYKDWHILVVPALIVMILGESLRVAAFFTAKSNFTHLVRYRKHAKHDLVTHGVYSFFRHPSYTGYFYFAVAGQIFLGNWISAIGFFIVLSRFFNQRIQDEEQCLALFFDKYLFYKKKTHIFIPFVKDPSSEDLMKLIIKYSSKTNYAKDD